MFANISGFQSLVCLAKLVIVERQWYIKSRISKAQPYTFIWDLLSAICSMLPREPAFVVSAVEWTRWVNFIPKSFGFC